MSVRLKFPALDALRGLAAIFIVVRHAGEFFGGNPFYNSFLAVDLFFLLSGFVIFHAYDKRILLGEISSRTFLKIRLIRLYPIYFISLVLCLLVATNSTQSIKGSDVFFNYLFALFFLPSNFSLMWSYGMLFPMNGAYWSLFYELAVNIYYSITRKIKGIEKINYYFLFLCLVLIIYFAIKAGSIDDGFTWGIGSFALGAARAFFGIFLGMALYKFQLGRPLVFLNKYSNVGPILLVSLILCMPNLNSINWIFQLGSIFLVFPLCLLWASRAKQHSSIEKIFVAFGLMSYPAYLLHVPVTQLINSYLSDDIKSYAPFSGFILIFILFFAFLLVEKYYERPMRKYLERVLSH